VPSGLKATRSSNPLCPRRGSPIGCAVAASKGRMVLSSLPLARSHGAGAARRRLHDG
jgi:hypothetical protein